MNTTFIVEDGFNTSYIDSILMALFYRTSHLQEILIQLPKKSKFVYLQDIINNNFIEQVRRNVSVDITIINEIRNYSFICGWKENLNITELYNVVDYLDFLIEGFDIGEIKCELLEISKNLQENIKSFYTNYIEIKVTDDNDIKTLLNKCIDINFNKKNNSTLTYYHFSELPLFVPIYLNRYDDNNQINNYKIDIKKKIRFNNNNNKLQSDASWIIHAIVCFSNSGNRHYYTIISTLDNKWCIFSNNKIPSLMKIDITDTVIANKIKQECVLILYRLDDNMCAI